MLVIRRIFSRWEGCERCRQGTDTYKVRGGCVHQQSHGCLWFLLLPGPRSMGLLMLPLADEKLVLYRCCGKSGEWCCKWSEYWYSSSQVCSYRCTMYVSQWRVLLWACERERERMCVCVCVCYVGLYTPNMIHEYPSKDHYQVESIVVIICHHFTVRLPFNFQQNFCQLYVHCSYQCI